MLRLSGHIPITENQVSPLEQIFHQCLRTSNCFLNFVPGADWGMKCIKKKRPCPSGEEVSVFMYLLIGSTTLEDCETFLLSLLDLLSQASILYAVLS